MAWLPVQESLPNHPKVRRLARMLDISRAAAIGHLVALWLWCLSYATEGDLSGFECWELAEAAQYEGDPVAFVGALEEAGFLDPHTEGEYGHSVHDWWEHVGKLCKRRADNAARMRDARAAHVQRTTETRVPAEQSREQYLRKEDQEQPRAKHPDDAAASDDEMKLRVYWAKAKKGKPPTQSDREAIISALQLPGMTYDRIHAVVDPLVEYKRKQGKDVGGFAYFLPVLSQEVSLSNLRVTLASHNLDGAPQVLTSASKPLIQDRDHYEVLVATGQFNPNEWGNASDFEEEF